jgi:hypothetical protein
MARRVAQTESMVHARDGGWLAGMGPLGLRRSALLAAPLAFFLVVGGAVAARTMLDSSASSAEKRQPAAADGKFDKKLVARLEKKLERPGDKPLAADLARLELAVLPWGEVLIDGKSRGVSPPLRTLDIPAGSHTIEIRNSTFPSHVAKVNVKAGQAIRIRHRFRK